MDQGGHVSDKVIRRRAFLTAAAASPLADAAQRMKLAIGCDHAGFPLKGPVLELLHSWGYTVRDCGTFSTAPVDFPDIAQKVTAEVLSGRAERAIMVCGSGIGACIACNKIPGIRAALIHDTYCAHQCVEHDNVNVACVGAWIIGVKTAEEVLKAYLNATFGTDEDLRRRVQKLDQMDRKK
jgi:ribose 5-phosphate isomerase B